jgi:hypothetical protein
MVSAGVIIPTSVGNLYQLALGRRSSCAFNPLTNEGNSYYCRSDCPSTAPFNPRNRGEGQQVYRGGNSTVNFQPLQSQGYHLECHFVVARDFSIPSSEGSLPPSSGRGPARPSFNPLTNEGNLYLERRNRDSRATFNPLERRECVPTYVQRNLRNCFQPPHVRGRLLSRLVERRIRFFQSPQARGLLSVQCSRGSYLRYFQPLQPQGYHLECHFVVARDFSIPAWRGDLRAESRRCNAPGRFNPLTFEGKLYLEICKLLKLKKNGPFWHQLCKLAPSKV